MLECERGRSGVSMWPDTGCFWPVPHPCLPMKPTGTQPALAPTAGMSILSSGHPSALGREEMLGPRKAPKKVHFPLKSSGISPEGCR